MIPELTVLRGVGTQEKQGKSRVSLELAAEKAQPVEAGIAADGRRGKKKWKEEEEEKEAEKSGVFFPGPELPNGAKRASLSAVILRQTRMPESLRRT